MLKENPVLEKSLAFALRIIKLNRYLIEEKKEVVLSRELLISGTRIGKHVNEAVNAESKTIYNSEIATARRAAVETEYWLQLLLQSDYLSEKAFNSIEADRLEIFKMLSAIVKTSKENE